MFLASSSLYTLGIMVHRRAAGFPFDNEHHYCKLSLKGAELGIDVLVFMPDSIDWSRERITGYKYDQSSARWEAGVFDLPRLVYDRHFAGDRRQMTAYRQTVHRLKLEKRVYFMNATLGNKWAVQQHLSKLDSVAPYLVPTTLLRPGQQAWTGLLRRHRRLFLKPNRGSQGRGTVGIIRHTGSVFEIRARDWHNHQIQHTITDIASLQHWLAIFTADRTYLVQPYLSLHTAAGDAYDIRSLVQKNRQGRWQTTGIAVRQGSTDSATANLHGGGIALEAIPFLSAEYGHKEADRLLTDIRRLSAEIPQALETDYGRLAELGLDFGIDRLGRLFLLEVNSKPGRTLFSRLSDPQLCDESVYNPVLYARFLLEGIR